MNETINNNTKVTIICSNIGGTCERADLYLPIWINAMKNLFIKNADNNTSYSDFIVIGLQEVGGTKKSSEITTAIIENWFNVIRDHKKINNNFDQKSLTVEKEKSENHLLLPSIKAELLEVLNSQPTLSPEVTIPINNASNSNCDNISELESYWHSGLVIENDNNSFTALACCFAIKKSILHTVFRWNWLTEEWDTVEQTKEELLVCTLTNSKYYKHARFTGTTSRKGYLLSRWKINGKELDLMNIHLYHDDSNLVAFAKTPSQYAEKKKRSFRRSFN